MDREGVAGGDGVDGKRLPRIEDLKDDSIDNIQQHIEELRGSALDCVLSCARPEDVEAILSAVNLVEDPEPSVRWKALVFLGTAPDSLLDAVRETLRRTRNGDRVKGLALLDLLSMSPVREIVASLSDRDSRVRGYAAAAAVRMAHRDPSPLRAAMRSDDPTIRQFAIDMAERMGVTPDA